MSDQKMLQRNWKARVRKPSTTSFRLGSLVQSVRGRNRGCHRRLCVNVVLVSRIIASRYSCSQIPFAREDRASLEDALSQFYSGIPPELRFEFLDAESREGLWAAMLNMAYK